MSFSVTFTLMSFSNLRNLLSILKSIVNNISHRHCIMNLCLIFHSQKNIWCSWILHDDSWFQNISIFLNNILSLIFVFTQCKRDRNFRCIKFLQKCRLDNLLSIINEIIKGISKYFVASYVFFCNSISHSHRQTPPIFVINRSTYSFLLYFHVTIDFTMLAFYQIMPYFSTVFIRRHSIFFEYLFAVC